MSPESDELKMLISKYRAMSIEELKALIKSWKGNTNCPEELQTLEIAKNELEIKYKDRKEQIELLTQSLTSSSRIRRWISSVKAVLNQFVESKN